MSFWKSVGRKFSIKDYRRCRRLLNEVKGSVKAVRNLPIKFDLKPEHYAISCKILKKKRVSLAEVFLGVAIFNGIESGGYEEKHVLSKYFGFSLEVLCEMNNSFDPLDSMIPYAIKKIKDHSGPLSKNSYSTLEDFIKDVEQVSGNVFNEIWDEGIIGVFDREVLSIIVAGMAVSRSIAVPPKMSILEGDTHSAEIYVRLWYKIVEEASSKYGFNCDGFEDKVPKYEWM